MGTLYILGDNWYHEKTEGVHFFVAYELSNQVVKELYSD